jgi:very-short-patch-repair endonuclease
MSKKEIKLEDSFAQHPKAKYWSDKNGDIKPKDIILNSKEKYYFNCDKCEHIFEKQIELITRLDRWCPYCANKKLCGNDDCKDCYNKTFATHEKAKFWSNMNDNIKPKDIARCTHTKYWFNCDCGHEIYLGIDKITLDNNWCSYCSSSPKLLCDKDCEKCFNKSFASHEKSKYWSEKNNTIPKQIFLNTHAKYWFNCNKCTHEFEMRINDVTNNKEWCIYCAGKRLCNYEDCKDCYNKSFANYVKSKYWSDKNCIKPRYVFKGTRKKFWFKCENNHEFEKNLDSITGKIETWCPKCYNKTENKLYNQLIKTYKSLEHQYRVNWCKNNNNYLPYDFVLKIEKIIIELDGEQHFKQVMKWKTPEETQTNDKYKIKCANINGYSVIRILQEDVYEDKYDWLKELDDNIKKIIKENKVQNIYMCKKNEYDVYI